MDVNFAEWFMDSFILPDILAGGGKILEPGDFREENRYIFELHMLKSDIGLKNLSKILKIKDSELKNWFLEGLPKDEEGRFSARVYLVVEVWVCLTELFGSREEQKIWFKTPQSFILNDPNKKMLPVDICTHFLEEFHEFLTNASDIVFMRHYEERCNDSSEFH